MIEVIYRIYEVADEETQAKMRTMMGEVGAYYSTSQAQNIELLMDCIICDSRDQFKEIIRDTYGKDITFRYSKKLQPGDVYCIIIGEHCYNSERYFNKVEYKCELCGASVSTYLTQPIMITARDASWNLYVIQDYIGKTFCCERCKSEYIDREKSTLRPGDDDHFWVDKEGFAKIQDKSIIGYIYKITKKSTGEFYIGQTKYVPIFRWGEHLHTDRFPLKNISDYQFEVITPVYKGQNILEVEKYYIQSYFVSDPEKSLNISGTVNLTNAN